MLNTVVLPDLEVNPAVGVNRENVGGLGGGGGGGTVLNGPSPDL